MTYFVFCIIVFLQGSLWGEDIKKILEKIPDQDQLKLEALFHDLINQDHFGYSLFGDKAVALSGHAVITHWENFILSRCTEGSFWDKWSIWEKYHTTLPMKNYLFLREPSPFHQAEMIVLINKKAFLKTLQAHLETFKTILGYEIQPEQFLLEIELGKKTFMNSIKGNVALMGILLGYGKHNATLYAHKRKIFKDSCLKGYGEGCLPSLLRVNSLDFMADLKHEETQKLHKKYCKLRNKLSLIYANGSFLKPSLIKLIE